MSHDLPLPQRFKGIALFTPGGDLIYCIDPHKQNRWHLQLCATLQEMLGLNEPPHFLVPCYTATIDRWLDAQTQQICTAAEASPLVLKHQALLNAIFDTALIWQESPRHEGLCDPLVLAIHRQQFPQLWQDHDLIVRSEQARRSGGSPQTQQTDEGYVLRLFVSGHTAATERILHNLYQMLDSLKQPYTLKVVDVYKHPEQAEIDQVTATPTLVKVYPEPTRRIVGDFDDVSRILQVLASPSG